MDAPRTLTRRFVVGRFKVDESGCAYSETPSGARNWARLIALGFAVVMFAFAPTEGGTRTRSGDVPPDLQSLSDARDSEGIFALIEARYRDHIGEPFPNIALRGRHGKRLTISDLHGSALLLFYAGGACPLSIEKLNELRAKNWTIPHGELVTVVKFLPMRELKDELEGNPRVFELEAFPPPGFLAYMRTYPQYFWIDENGIFVGFQLGKRAAIGRTDSNTQGGEE